MSKFFFLFLCLATLVNPVMAQLDDQVEALAKIRDYIKELDQKIVEARAARQINKLAELKHLKRAELEKAKILAEKIERSKTGTDRQTTADQPQEKGVVLKEGEETGLKSLEELNLKEVLEKKNEPAENLREAGFHIGGGIGGATLLLSGGCFLPVQQNFDLMLRAGYGYGSKHRILDLGLVGVFPIGENYVGFDFDLVNYSHNTAVLGLSEEIGQGTRTGYGIVAGRKIGKINVQLGYNTALGLTFGIIYKFKNIIVVDIEE